LTNFDFAKGISSTNNSIKVEFDIKKKDIIINYKNFKLNIGYYEKRNINPIKFPYYRYD
jgi:hypothetical protein